MARRTVRAAGVVTTCALALAIVFGARTAGAEPSATPSGSAHVYVLTGFLGFPTRLHGAVERVERHHVPVTVGHALEWSTMAASAIEAYRRGQVRSVIIVGYSLGGGSALKMAAQLADAHAPLGLIR